jgi:hypothetical protein
MPKAEANDNGSITKIAPQALEVELTDNDGDRSIETGDPAVAKQLKEESEEQQGSSLSLPVIYRFINDQLANSMPPQTKADVHDLRKTGFAQLITLSYLAVYLITLIVNSILGHRQLRNEVFLSPDLYAGECDEVPLAITSVYEADSYGKWDTETGFVSTLSMYAVDLRGTKVTNDEYPEVMRKFRDAFESQADKSVHRDLSYSMVTLASYNLVDNNKQMGFFANARAEKIFGSTVFASAITDQYGWCSDSNAKYDSAAGMINYEVDFKSADAPNPCPQLNAKDFMTRDIESNGIKNMKFDIKSIATAVAINLGMNRLSEDLTMIRPAKWEYDYNNLVFVPANTSDDEFSRYVDPYYEDMAPIYCYNGYKFGKRDYCLLEGDRNENNGDTTYYYPMITQYGNWGEELMCTCGKDGTVNTVPGMNFYCSESDFLVSLVYVPSSTTSTPTGGGTPAPTEAPTEGPTPGLTGYADDIDSIFAFAESISKIWEDDPKDGDLKIAKRFHPAQFHSVFSMGNLTALSNAFDILCKGNCSMFTIEFWGSSLSPMNSRGTPVYVMFNQTRMSACSNGIYRAEAFAPLIEKPPVTLVQSYYTCILNNTVAIQRAVGIAAGSSALYAGVLLNLMLMVIVDSYNLKHDDKIIDPAEKKQIMEQDVAQLKHEFNSQMAASKNELAELKTVIQSMQKLLAAK